ncbi:MAG: amidohydrolase family protein [Bacteroidetes bacterium]|nr:amidohydrolase family protein [Bacteroidota bacterium]
MRKIIIITLLLSFTQILFSQTRSTIIIKDANIISMKDEKLSGLKSILIKDGKIVQIDDYAKIKKTKTAYIIDAKGKYLMPGLADMHVHLPASSKIDTLLLTNLAAGITHVRVMNNEEAQLQTKARLVKDAGIASPKMHYSFLVTKDMKYTAKQFDSLVKDVKQKGYDFIKLFSIADEDAFTNLMTSANKNKIMVCGHFPSAVSIDKVINSGFKSIEHLGGYDKLKDSTQLSAVIKLSKEKGMYNCPTLDYDVMAAYQRFPDDYKNRLVFSFAPKKLLDAWESEYKKGVEENGGADKILEFKNKYNPVFKNKLSIIKKLADANCNLLMGSDPGSPFQMAGFNVYEEMLLWSKAGISNYQILRAATIIPAQFFGQDRNWGSIEIGKDGDVIILEKNPLENILNIGTVETTICNGKVYKNKEILNKL